MTKTIIIESMTETALDVMDEKQMLMNDEIKHPAIFILGAKGVGKSTLGNMLLGSYSEVNVSPVFPISDRDYDDEKEEIYRTAELNIKGEKYTIIDTIGIPESESNSTDIWNKLKEVEKKATNIQAYIFVLEGGRLTQHELLFIHQLFTRYPKSRTIVVFTKVRKALILSVTEMKKTFNTQISTLLQSINDRWLVMPSLDIFGNNEGKTVIASFVDDLKKLILTIEGKGGVKKDKLKGGTTRGIKPKGTGLAKKFCYSFILVFFITAIIIIILISIHKLIVK
ncbi:hypothetical protein GLOIN_2v1658506 [Rhizophagus clarus]|uniref:AIG1-type G domain-containing protein n=2 Tax=Rhizophagus clarus TaxID=94130 RepID=A0A8H3KWN1_9GLOM|nr:hypothetical protein GLOIN_2v1658506 [Rhizophagus clarus]